jgi:serine/threonine-protein kinase
MALDPNAESTPAGNVIAGKLRIVRTLGVGGMGTVYEVKHEITAHRRALKLLHHQMAEVPGVVERFLREASAAGRIGNPHIVETFDAGRLDTGEPYIVMELLQGMSLASKLNETGPLDIATACDILLQTCDGVAAAHAAGIIHRDLKPENLFLVGPQLNYVKILDFGISKFDAAITGVEGFTVEGSPIGTPFYMSPEQVRGQKTVDACTDVYALGVVLYECLTNKRPFDADNLPHLVYLISQGQYTSPSLLRPSLPRALDAIVAKALALDRSERYSSATELARAILQLRQSLAPPPIEPPVPPSISGLPPRESDRSAPALTPDVFSNSAMQYAQNKASRPSKRHLYWTVGSIITFSLGAFAVTAITHRTQRSSSAALDSSAFVPHSVLSASNLTPQNSAIVVLPIANTPSATASSSTITALPTPIKNDKALSAKPSKPEALVKAKNRAAAVGLAEENPFK